jgi:hypothetical protein
MSSLMQPEEIKAIVMEELLGALSPDEQQQTRLQRLEEEIHPLFVALPKNEYGNLGHAAAGYLVHRLFLQRHGVVINGIAPMADAFNSSSIAESLDGRVPSRVQSIFEDRVKGHGLGIHELALLTSTLERLMHQDIFSELASLYYDQLNYSTPSIDRATATEVMSLYLINYGIRVPTPLDWWRRFQKNPAAGSPRWVKFVDSVVEAVAGHPFTDGFIAFGDLVTFGDFLVQRLAREQGERCSKIKATLSEMEIGSTGEVPLEDLYQSFLDGRNIIFEESVDLLRTIGALKEHQDGTIGVLSANYLTSPVNCNNGSSFHMVCCQNECEPILDWLDREIANPLATPEQVVRAISFSRSPIPSPSRILSSELTDRLDTIASQHGGSIALHGRMFAEWLHAAFPSKCPYPHSAGTIDPSAAHTWSVDRRVAGIDDMRREVKEQRLARLAVAKAGGKGWQAGSNRMPQHWSEQEELLAHHKQSQSQGAQATSGLLTAAHYMAFSVANVLVIGGLLWQPIKSVLAYREQLLPFAKGKMHQC